MSPTIEAAEMTTWTTGHRRTGSTRVLLGSGAVGLAAGLALAGLGAVLEGMAAGLGGVVGTLVAVTVLWGGAAVVDLVAGTLPSASLLVALLTYTLQVVVLALVLVALSGSGLLAGTLDRTWLGASVMAVTLAWLVAQIVLTTRRRIPAFDEQTGGLR